MHPADMSTGEWHLSAGGGAQKTGQQSAKFFRLPHLRKFRGCEQVAAVCYRVGDRGIEFLLVQTRGGHWIFPKGSAEAGLTSAQAAALEAFEEAGVHGRMEEASFARYVRRKRGEMRDSGSTEIVVNAHLCEVSWLEAPQEADRNPTWFNAEKAKRRLREDRTPQYGAELARVIDVALIRIRQRSVRDRSIIFAIRGLRRNRRNKNYRKWAGETPKVSPR